MLNRQTPAFIQQPVDTSQHLTRRRSTSFHLFHQHREASACCLRSLLRVVAQMLITAISERAPRFTMTTTTMRAPCLPAWLMRARRRAGSSLRRLLARATCDDAQRASWRQMLIATVVIVVALAAAVAVRRLLLLLARLGCAPPPARPPPSKPTRPPSAHVRDRCGRDASYDVRCVFFARIASGCENVRVCLGRAIFPLRISACARASPPVRPPSLHSPRRRVFRVLGVIPTICM